MKRNVKQKTLTPALLTASCIVIALSGCAKEEETTNEQNAGQEITAEDIQLPEPVTDKSTEISVADNQAVSEPVAGSGTVADSPDNQETATDSQSLYDQFLNNNVAVTVSSDYPLPDYMVPIFEKGSSFTLTELGTRVSQYYLDPEYTDKTSYDYIQYAYIDCPDTADTTDKNLLIKFVGLNIYSQDDDSYSVYIISENNGQLYMTGEYQCWARSETTACTNGTLKDSGSSGAGDHNYGLSAILSNGKITPIYSTEELYGWWTSSVNDVIYNEIFDENAVCNLIVAIYTVGDNKYYLYDTSECSEEEIPQCGNYISRCRDEAGINWVTDAEIQTAVQNQCNVIGIDYGITQQQDEVAWNNL